MKTGRQTLDYPYSKAEPAPSSDDPPAQVDVDRELGREGFTYHLASGSTGTVHIDQVLEYNQDPDYLRDVLVYRLSLEAQRQVAGSGLSKREIIRRLGTSPTQLYRLLDQTNTRKSIDKLVSLFQVVGCDVDVVVRRTKKRRSAT